jgi:hypothetical protein
MARSLPFHCATTRIPSVFHNNIACAEGDAITSSHWRAGDDGRRLCDLCAELNAAEHVPKQLATR